MKMFVLFTSKVSVANGSLEYSVGSIRYLATTTPNNDDALTMWLPIILSSVFLLALFVILVLAFIAGMIWIMRIKQQNR